MNMILGLSPVTFWLILAGVALITELCSGSVVMLCVAIGCVAALLPALCGGSLLLQVIIAAAVAILSLIILGPAIRRIYQRPKDTKPSNMDALIGRIGTVTVPVTHDHGDGGRVRIDGDNWLAFTASENVPVPVGDKVRVQGYDSLVLKVVPVSPNAINP